jgi:hypothetical protein
MDLFSTLGAALLPASAQRKLFLSKDHHACLLADRAAEMCDVAIEAQDLEMAQRYAAITLRIIHYRENLLHRFPLGIS